MTGGRKSPSREQIPLPTLAEPKGYDYATSRDADATLRNAPPHDHDHNDLVDGAASDTTASDSSDDFDWNADEDGIASEHKAHHHLKTRRGRSCWKLFTRLAKPIRVIIVGILGTGVLITPLLVFQLKFKTSVARPHVFLWSLWLAIIWAASCLTYIVVDTLPRLTVALIDLFDGDVENQKIQIELLFAVRAWIKLALDISWAWIALSVLRDIYNPPGSYWTIINRVMEVPLFSVGLILLAEKIFLRFVAINFHRKALAERIAENRLGLKALDRLSQQNAPPSRRGGGATYKKGHKSSPSGSLSALNKFTRTQAHVHEVPANGRSSTSVSPVNENEKGALVDGHRDGHKGKSKRDERKQRRRKALASIIVDQVGSAIGQVALKNSQFNKAGDYSGVYSARRLARKLFMQLSDVEPAREHLVVEDFEPYFGSEGEAHAAFAIFDKDGNGDLTKKEMREAVARIYGERKALVASLKDVGSAVAKLDAVLIGCALILIIFICLLIFNRKDTLASLVPMATIVLGFSFIFGHSAQILFESLIFIFSTHVFDVGDLVFIDDNPLFVKEFGLFSTVFRRVDGTEIIAPNSLMSSSKLVHNMRRSGSMWETTNVQIAYDTPMELVEQLRQRLHAYAQANNREWSNVAVHIDKMEYQNCITLIIAMEHRPNWQDWGGRWARRTPFMKNLKTVLEELDLRYTLPVRPLLMPRTSPGPPRRLSPRGGGFDPTRLRSPSGESGRYKMSREEQGNAGYFPSDPIGRAPGMSISGEPNTMGGSSGDRSGAF